MNSFRPSSLWSPSRAAALRAAKRKTTLNPQIDVTGLLSIMVALLFTLTSPSWFYADLPRFSVNLPTASSAAPQPGAMREDAIRISVTRDGRISCGEREVPLDWLPARIGESIRAGAEPKVYLLADARASAGDVNRAVEQIQRAGITNVVILAEKPRR